MSQPFSSSGKSTTNRDTAAPHSAWLDVFQLAVGLILVIASGFGYVLLQQAPVLIPAIMGAILLFNGGRSLLAYREQPFFGRDNEESTNRMSA